MSHEYFHVVSMEAAEVKIIQLQERISALEAELAERHEYDLKMEKAFASFGVQLTEGPYDGIMTLGNMLYDANQRICQLERVASAAREMREHFSGFGAERLTIEDVNAIFMVNNELSALDSGDTP